MTSADPTKAARFVAELDRLAQDLSEQEAEWLTDACLMMAARLAFDTPEHKQGAFRRAERMGLHFLPVHFYSPVPDTSGLPPSAWSARFDQIPGLELNRPRIFDILRSFKPFAHELDVFTQEQERLGEFHWNNSQFTYGDAAALYCFIRRNKPNFMVEIGSGYSTLVARAAMDKNGTGQIICIEPYPNEDIRHLAASGRVRLIEKPVQEVSIHTYHVLRAGDILFIDSTHVAKVGSDVNHEFFRVLPRVPAGVLVHVHDIFYPNDYPREWVLDHQIFWTEQYLLMAFLAFNKEFEVLLPNNALVTEHDLSAAFSETFPKAQHPGGGSFWMRRLAKSEG
jgi:predicted O-methyltransferase YrrM